MTAVFRSEPPAQQPPAPTFLAKASTAAVSPLVIRGAFAQGYRSSEPGWAAYETYVGAINRPFVIGTPAAAAGVQFATLGSLQQAGIRRREVAFRQRNKVIIFNSRATPGTPAPGSFLTARGPFTQTIVLPDPGRAAYTLYARGLNTGPAVVQPLAPQVIRTGPFTQTIAPLDPGRAPYSIVTAEIRGFPGRGAVIPPPPVGNFVQAFVPFAYDFSVYGQRGGHRGGPTTPAPVPQVIYSGSFTQTIGALDAGRAPYQLAASSTLGVALFSGPPFIFVANTQFPHRFDPGQAPWISLYRSIGIAPFPQPKMAILPNAFTQPPTIVPLPRQDQAWRHLLEPRGTWRLVSAHVITASLDAELVKSHAKTILISAMLRSFNHRAPHERTVYVGESRG